MNVLVTGGTGFIGSHTSVELLACGHEVTILDNLVNSGVEVLASIEAISQKMPAFVQGDIRDRALLERVIRDHSIDSVIHFAALKSVGESWERPLDYFDNNVAGTISLLQAMQACDVGRFVFSSSATVYGEADQCPIPESANTRTTNPYGRSKLICEQMLEDLVVSAPSLSVASLRYFNPVGAHPSGMIGEAPHGIPNNLMPYISQVASGKREYLRVFGNDYATVDGTGVRDYIHVVDLAQAHVKALEFLVRDERSITVNLGTGRGHSVLEVVAAFERASGRQIPLRIAERRAGDVASCFADPSVAHELLGWRSSRGLDQMCVDAWRWQMRVDSMKA
ncbi:UDP-glucose 4-epimerase GalE [Stenotrophomonas sp.]|uniref:UDP-glucose 4-epimerase GalE n=1 Tax=Stenotrophomonas sp. TaxID=69392 RepID=UPI0028A0811C|nr:UDP-glucose 4-epimerase GalE [Stenotrophomonas sp.]